MGEVNGIESWHIKKYVWRESGNLEYAYELFMDEYDDWVNDCKDIAFKAKAVFEEHIKGWYVN